MFTTFLINGIGARESRQPSVGLMTLNRERFKGVQDILAFNRTFYIGTLGAVIAVVLTATIMSRFIGVRMLLLVYVACAAALFWTISSLAVSHYIYDRSGLYSLGWLPIQPRHWLNIHVGLDEFTHRLQQRLPGSRAVVYDVFDPIEMPEPSIAKARELGRTPPQTPVRWNALPSSDDTFEAVFLAFAAHEFRRTPARHALFHEVTRVLHSGGSLLVIEHLRDLPNFLAFGPGALHFQWRQTWLKAAQAAKLRLAAEFSVTPFVHVFQFQKD